MTENIKCKLLFLTDTFFSKKRCKFPHVLDTNDDFACRMPLVNNNTYLELARRDFNRCQVQHQLEWHGLQKYA